MTILYANLDSGLFNKKDEIQIYVNKHKPDIMCFNEIFSKKKKSFEMCEYSFDNYESFYSPNMLGRGAVIYTMNSLKVSQVDMLSDNYFSDSVWCRLKLDKGDSLLIGCVYRSPSSSVENCINMNNVIYEAVKLRDTHLLIVGDFNYPEMDWEFRQTSESMQHNASIFINCINDTFLY